MSVVFWIAFIAFVVFMLVLDVKMFHKRAHAVTIREASLWTLFWVVLAVLFVIPLYYIYEHNWLGMSGGLSGYEAVEQYLTGWLIEKSLSVDNIFVFALIFTYFEVPAHLQHRVLFWGIIGALVLRCFMVLAGAALIHNFESVQYLFALLLLYAAVKMLFFGNQKFDPNKNFLFRLAHRMCPVSTGYSKEKFFVRLPDNRLAITPLFLVLLVIESSDVLFAFDSVPAIFGITKDAFLVFTSNIFAILGLRSLYFVLEAMISRFHLLKYSLVVILVFVAIKMLIEKIYVISTTLSLAFVVVMLILGVIASLVSSRSKGKSA